MADAVRSERRLRTAGIPVVLPRAGGTPAVRGVEFRRTAFEKTAGGCNATTPVPYFSLSPDDPQDQDTDMIKGTK
jgi:hypothetical protein